MTDETEAIILDHQTKIRKQFMDRVYREMENCETANDFYEFVSELAMADTPLTEIEMEKLVNTARENVMGRQRERMDIELEKVINQYDFYMRMGLPVPKLIQRQMLFINEIMHLRSLNTKEESNDYPF